MLSVFRGSVADCAPSGFCCSMTLDGAVVPRFGIFPTWRRKFTKGQRPMGISRTRKVGVQGILRDFIQKNMGFYGILWDVYLNLW